MGQFGAYPDLRTLAYSASWVEFNPALYVECPRVSASNMHAVIEGVIRNALLISCPIVKSSPRQSRGSILNRTPLGSIAAGQTIYRALLFSAWPSF